MKKIIVYLMTISLMVMLGACGNEEQVAEYEKEIAKLEAQVAEYQQQIKSLEEKSVSDQGQFSDLQTKFSELESEAASLLTKLEVLEAEKGELQNELTNSEQVIEKYEEEVAALNGELEQLNEKHNPQVEPVVLEGQLYTVPVGCSYVSKDNVTYAEGSQLYGSQLQNGDRLFTGEYIYTYGSFSNNDGDNIGNGWEVDVVDQTKTSYPELINHMDIPIISLNGTFGSCDNLVTSPVIPDTVRLMETTFWSCANLVEAPVIPEGVIDLRQTFEECTSLENVPALPEGVKYLSYTFHGCTSLKVAPQLPSTVVSMDCTFYNCLSLEEAPNIPDGVTNMNGTFINCYELKTAPVIPAGVLDMDETFWKCKGLTGEVIIHANPTRWYLCLAGVSLEKQGITLSGDSVMLDVLAATCEQ